ncbi:MAG TPA: hypothetical protein VFH51_06335, partial [Myxococcota bacterium]|nr:hypothetical protein [Myxococcota bacterium]
MSRFARVSRIAFVGIFLTILVAPGAVMLVTPDEELVIVGEAKQPRPRPSGLRQMGPHLLAYHTWFNRSFGLRQAMLSINAKLNFALLHRSTSDKVAVGRNAWLFYTDDTELACSRHLRPFSDEQILYYRDLVRSHARWMREQGIHFIMIVGPDKHTIYPELLPLSMRSVGPTSRFEQLAAELARSAPEVDFIDMRPVLLADKATHQVYYRDDTHWNERGVFLAYREIVRHLEARFGPLGARTEEDFAWDQQMQVVGDLARMAGLTSQQETVPKLTPKRPWAATLRDKRGAPPRPGGPPPEASTDCSGAPLDRALLLHDSFGERFAWPLAELFGHMELSRHNFL